MKIKEGKTYFKGKRKVFVIKLEKGKPALVCKLPHSPDSSPFYYPESLLNKRAIKK